MTAMEFPNLKMRMFPLEDMMGVGGTLCSSGDFYQPSAPASPMVYLNANPDVQNVLDKVEAAGGKILVPKTNISPDYGDMPVILDKEGNRIAFHSVPQTANEKFSHYIKRCLSPVMLF